MSQMWSFENYTPETHLLVIEGLKKENKKLKDELERVKNDLDLCLTTIADLKGMASTQGVLDSGDHLGCVGLQPMFRYEDDDLPPSPPPSPPPRREHRRASP